MARKSRVITEIQKQESTKALNGKSVFISDFPKKI